MKIKLISPRVTLRPMDSAWKTHMAPPLALLVLGALTSPGHDVVIEDENVEKTNDADRPDLVGITVKADTFYRAAEISGHYRARGIPVVWGGIHPTVCPDDCLRHADSVVIGEAEETWSALLADASAARLKPVYRNDHPVDPSLTPIPRWDLLKEKNYLFTNTLCIGRGCPWRCDFCYNSSDNIPARYRMKPVENILAEIASLGIRHVMFIDDNFIGDPGRVRQLLPALRKMNLTWHAAVSADIGRQAGLLEQMAESGCKSLFIGFESVNPLNLLNCHKAQNRIEEYDATVSRIHRCGIMVNASLVFGFDEDDESVFQSTLAWLVRNRIATMTAHILTPYPGTRFYRKLQAEDRILDHDLRHYNTSRVVFRPNKISAEALEEGYLRMYDQLYSWGNIWRRRPALPGQLVAYLEFNLLYRKFGKVLSRLGQFIGMRGLAKLAKAVAYPSLKMRVPGDVDLIGAADIDPALAP